MTLQKLPIDILKKASGEKTSSDINVILWGGFPRTDTL